MMRFILASTIAAAAAYSPAMAPMSKIAASRVAAAPVMAEGKPVTIGAACVSRSQN